MFTGAYFGIVDSKTYRNYDGKRGNYSYDAATGTLRLISGPSEWANLLVVFLPMVTGYMMTHHLFFRYEVLFSLHMLAIDLMPIWIPFSRISHFMFYFFSRTFHGAQAGKRAVAP